MATNPTPQPQVTTTQLLSDLHVQFANLAHKHATISFLLIGVLVLVLAVAGVGGYLGLKAYDKALAKADAQNAQYQQDKQAWQTALAQSEAQRAQLEAKQATVVHTIEIRDKQADQAIQNAVKPGADINSIKSSLERVYGDVPSFGLLPPVEGQNLIVPPLQAQQLIVYKVDRDRLAADYNDEIQIVGIQNQSISSLNKDLSQCKALQTESDKVIADYKKLAHKSKFQKFIGGAEKVIIFVAGAYIGHKL